MSDEKPSIAKRIKDLCDPEEKIQSIAQIIYRDAVSRVIASNQCFLDEATRLRILNQSFEAAVAYVQREDQRWSVINVKVDKICEEEGYAPKQT